VLGSVVDFYAAALIAYGVSAALFHRERTGEGQYVGLSLLGAALAMQSTRFVWARSEGRSAERDLRSGGVTGIHPTAGGEIYLSANTPHFWRALCKAIGLPELAEDPNYDTVRKRAKQAAGIVPRIREALRQHTAAEWEGILGEQVPVVRYERLKTCSTTPRCWRKAWSAPSNTPGPAATGACESH